MGRRTLADERGTAVRAVDDLDVNIPALMQALHRIANSIGLAYPFGPCGVSVRLYASSGVCNGSVIVSQAEHDGAEWIHASIARENHMPTYADLAALHKGAFGAGRYAYQVFAAAERHVNIHEYALHLWGRADGVNVFPDFGAGGTI